MFKLLLTTVRTISLNGTTISTLVIEFDSMHEADVAFNAIEKNKRDLNSDTGALQNVIKLY